MGEFRYPSLPPRRPRGLWSSLLLLALTLVLAVIVIADMAGGP